MKEKTVYGMGKNHPRKIQPIERTYINKQILYSSLIGDGSIDKTYYSYNETHCIAQKDYALWKNKHLNISFKYRTTGVYEKHNGCYIHSSNNDPWMIELRELFYPNNIRIVTKEILDNINKLGLLIWYLDDGTLNKRANFINFYTQRLTYPEQLLIQNWFKNKWGISLKIYPLNRVIKNGNYLHLSSESTKKLLSILRPVFIKYKLPECMKYKLWR